MRRASNREMNTVASFVFFLFFLTRPITRGLVMMKNHDSAFFQLVPLFLSLFLSLKLNFPKGSVDL